MNKIRNLISALLGLVVLAALAGGGGPGPVRSDSPVQMPTPQPTEPATLTPTPPPTETPWPTATPSPIPSPQPYPTPEWAPYEGDPFTIVFQRRSELWLSEVGGQGERPLTNEGLHTDEGPYFGVSSFAVSPDGQRVAYVVRDEQNDFVKVVSVLDGNTCVVDSTSEPYGVIDYGLTGPQAWWDDTHVAYYRRHEAGEDPTSWSMDLVIVDLETDQRTVEPVSAIQWPSPDGRYVLSGFQLHDRETGGQWKVIEEDRQTIFVG